MSAAARYAVLWSGGKDSALALVRAGQAGLEVDLLLTFGDAGTGRIRFHGENGEYHSFAFAGPAFTRPLGRRPGERRSDGRFVQLDVLQ